MLCYLVTRNRISIGSCFGQVKTWRLKTSFHQTKTAEMLYRLRGNRYFLISLNWFGITKWKLLSLKPEPNWLSELRLFYISRLNWCRRIMHEISECRRYWSWNRCDFYRHLGHMFDTTNSTYRNFFKHKNFVFLLCYKFNFFSISCSFHVRENPTKQRYQIWISFDLDLPDSH